MALSALGAGLISAGVSTAGNLIGGLLSNGISYSQQRKLAEQQFQYQKELNQMAMDYNNPQNQMTMWRNAGINPNAGSYLRYLDQQLVTATSLYWRIG